MKWRGGAKTAIGPDGASAVEAKRIDLALLRALIKAETWKQRLSRVEPVWMLWRTPKASTAPTPSVSSGLHGSVRH